jgi:hypothetical protein
MTMRALIIAVLYCSTSFQGYRICDDGHGYRSTEWRWQGSQDSDGNRRTTNRWQGIETTTVWPRPER